jgi:type I restriction enzyme R subunit
MSNFTFLKTDWPELYETAREAEQNVASTPLSHRLYARRSLERAVKWLYANDSYLKQPYADNSGLYRTWGKSVGSRLDLLTFF